LGEIPVKLSKLGLSNILNLEVLSFPTALAASILSFIKAYVVRWSSPTTPPFICLYGWRSM